jgi:hypothetical protein
MANIYAYKIPELWLKALQSDASGLILQAHMCRGKGFIPFPFTNSPGYAFWLAADIDKPNNFNLERISVVPGLHTIQVFWSYIWQSNQLYLAWPGLHTSISLLLCLVLMRQRKIPDASEFLCIFLISRTVILLAFTTAQDFRYMYSGYFISLGFITTYIITLMDKKEVGNLKTKKVSRIINNQKNV